jgi:hypothetical protein
MDLRLKDGHRDAVYGELAASSEWSHQQGIAECVGKTARISA